MFSLLMWPKMSWGNVPFAWQLFWVGLPFILPYCWANKGSFFSSACSVSCSRWLDRKLLIVWRGDFCVKRRDSVPCFKGQQLERVEGTIVCAMSRSLSSKEF